MYRAFFTEAGLKALWQLAADRRFLDPTDTPIFVRSLICSQRWKCHSSVGSILRKKQIMSDVIDLGVLDRFLMSDAAPDNSMGLSDLDGFLTGILVGPDLVMPSEWLPRILGGEKPVFESTEQAQEVLAAIMGRYNEIAQSLDGHPDDLNPIYWENAEKNIVIAADWAEGFLEAVEMRADAWLPLIRDKKAGILLMPILALCGDREEQSMLPLDAETEAEIVAEAPEMIPVCVCAIRHFWHERMGQSSPIRHPPKIGRNDPCPCGSGRKYKRCCRAN
jgi:uncharacterized protein